MNQKNSITVYILPSLPRQSNWIIESITMAYCRSLPSAVIPFRGPPTSGRCSRGSSFSSRRWEGRKGGDLRNLSHTPGARCGQWAGRRVLGHGPPKAHDMKVAGAAGGPRCHRRGFGCDNWDRGCRLGGRCRRSDGHHRSGGCYQSGRDRGSTGIRQVLER